MRDDLFLHNVNPEFFLQDVKPEKLSFSSLYCSSLFSAILHFAPFKNDKPTHQQESELFRVSDDEPHPLRPGVLSCPGGAQDAVVHGPTAQGVNYHKTGDADQSHPEDKVVKHSLSPQQYY